MEEARDPAVTSLPGNFHFAEGAGLCSIYDSYDTLDMLAQYWPLRIAQHNDRNDALGEILLKADVLVGGHKYFKSSYLRRFQ